MIGTRQIEGREALTIASADGALEAAYVPSAGMICCSLLHEGEEILGRRHGLRGYVEDRSTMGIPILYPWANRLSSDHFEVAGKTVDLRDTPLVKRDANGLPIHGLLNAYPDWRVTVHQADSGGAALEADLDWSADARLLRCFPFPHRLAIRAAISERGLAITTTVAAEKHPVPIAFGFHPYLTLPGVPRDRWQLDLPLSDHLGLDPRGLPTGVASGEPLHPGPLGDRVFDDLYRSAPPATPLSISGGRTISVSMSAGYPYTQIYAPRGESLIALEPMADSTDALTGGRVRLLAPGDEFSAGFAVRPA